MGKHEGTLVRANIGYLEKLLLDERGLYKAVPADQLYTIPLNDLQVFANDYAIFQLVTTELIDWLKIEMAGSKALEICAGNGVISRSLGIIGIDSRVQETPYFQRILKEKYGEKAAQISLTSPPKEIKKYEALEAVRVFRPEIVVGAFVTPKVTREQTAKRNYGKRLWS